MTANSLSQIITNPSCMDDYDPSAMSVSKARQFIRKFLNPVVETEILPIKDCLGRILAEKLLAPANVPNYNNSAMDGYAYHADAIKPEVPITLKIAGTAFAGKGFTGTLAINECVRIMTGGIMPAGTDTVIMQERVHVENGFISFNEAPKRGMNVRYAGEDLQQGQMVLTTGHLIRPADLGLIASLGVSHVRVYRKLKVAFFSTGDELTDVADTLKIGQVYDSNRYTLFGMLSRLGVTAIDLGAVPDDLGLLESTLLNAANIADVVVSSGGVSVGEADYMKMLLAKHGQVVFWKISMKPGRPLAFGSLQANNTHQAQYFGLPGNPVAVMVTFYQFVREAMLILMGQPYPAAFPTFNVECIEPMKKMVGRTEFQRGLLFADEDGLWKVKPTGAQGSAILSSMSQANCFIVLAESVGNLEAGAMVSVQVLDGII